MQKNRTHKKTEHSEPVYNKTESGKTVPDKTVFKKTVIKKSVSKKSVQERILTFLYETLPGRLLLRPLTAPWFSKTGGFLLDTKLSALAVRPFVKANVIDLTMCRKKKFDSFNDFFTRKLLEDARPVDDTCTALVSPCDCRLSVYPVTADGQFVVKRTVYTLPELLRSHRLAEHYQGGWLWLCRLGVDDYHRYIYPDNARVTSIVRIPGIFHTVNPIANDHYPIYKENTREYCLLQTENFGTVLMMEVGALLVGRIENELPAEAYCDDNMAGTAGSEERLHGNKYRSSKLHGTVKRGQEKGHFAFGGSTIILLTPAGRVRPERVYVENTQAGIETKVKMGEGIGNACIYNDAML